MAAANLAWAPYCGAAPLPADWLGRWNFDPILLVGLAAVALAWQRRTGPQALGWNGAALGLLLLLFVSPFCALTSALFSARVAHHVLLTAVAAPLLALAMPAERARLPGSIAAWTGIQVLVFWLWHAPPLYAAALSNVGIYGLMQLSLLGSALGFWIVLRRTAAPGAVAALLATMMLMGLLGALITFAGRPLYAPHFAATAGWGLTPIEDQQLAGLIMWAPAAGLYLGAALLLASRWLGRESAGLAS
jgi:putative membrane protein